MRKNIIWAAVALALIAIPAVVGLLVVGGDDGRRSGALVSDTPGMGYKLVIPGLTPTGQAIAVNSYSWGVTNPGAASAATGGTGAGRAQFGQLELTKGLDQMSPLLAQAVASGKAYPSATLRLYKGADMPQNYATYTLTNVFVASVQHGGAADEVPNESVSLNYGRISVNVAAQDPKGSITPGNEFRWDLATATKY